MRVGGHYSLLAMYNKITEHVHRADMWNQVMPKQAQQIMQD